MAKRKKKGEPGRPPVDRDDTFPERVGGQIRSRRNAKRLSVAATAEAAGVPASTWYHWEAGRHLPLERLPEIAAALECSVRSLIPSE